MIHYHGGDIGGKRDTAHRFFQGRHVMISFAAPALLPIVAEVCSSFALDNGAFTTWRQGKEFDLSGFYAWADEWTNHPACDFAIIPDKIDGTERDNDRLVNDLGRRREKWVPVWHFHESPRRLAALAGWWGKVALGSSGQWPTPGLESWWDRIDSVMPRIVMEDGRPWCKLHGLRMLDPEIFTRLPLHSADSCNAVINAKSVTRFGMYAHPETSGRANVIADRIEQHQSAARWEPRQKTKSMFALEIA